MYTSQKTTMLTKEEGRADKKWLLFDATGKTLGRFASEVAKVLRGKHKVTYTPHQDCGDGVIIINADKIVVTGSKEARKEYIHYTGHMGGLRRTPYREMQKKKPDFILYHAISGMMPKTRLAKQQLRHLRVIAAPTHNLHAQQPTLVNI